MYWYTWYVVVGPHPTWRNATCSLNDDSIFYLYIPTLDVFRLALPDRVDTRPYRRSVGYATRQKRKHHRTYIY